MAKDVKMMKNKTAKAGKPGKIKPDTAKPKVAGKNKVAGGAKPGMAARIDKLEKMHKSMKKEHKTIAARLHALDGKGEQAAAPEAAEQSGAEMHEGE